jgi:glycosyltransferase involved in cell wall biosynthesis
MSTGPAPEHPVSPLKILIVVEPGIAGTFGHVEGLVHFLLAQNQQVFLAYSDKRKSPNQVRLIEYIEKSGGKCLNLKVGNVPSLGDLPAFFKLWGFANEIRPDVIHSHSSKAGVLARALALCGIRCRQLYTPHAYYGLAPRPGLMSIFYNKLESLFGKIGQTINVSEDERNFALQTLHLDPARCLLIPIAVDTAKFLPATSDEKKKARGKMKIPEDAILLGWIGRLSFQKDPQTLYRALGLLHRGKSKCHLLHVGQGEGQESLDQLALDLDLQPHITRIPHLPDPLGFYHAIDGLILTSRYEGCPTAALESLSSNLPVILSKAPGANWLTQSHLTHCWCASPGDAAGFADAISQWLVDLPLRRESNHRTFAVERFSPAHIYGAILKTYRHKPTYLS